MNSSLLLWILILSRPLEAGEMAAFSGIPRIGYYDIPNRRPRQQSTTKSVSPKFWMPWRECTMARLSIQSTSISAHTDIRQEGFIRIRNNLWCASAINARRWSAGFSSWKKGFVTVSTEGWSFSFVDEYGIPDTMSLFLHYWTSPNLSNLIQKLISDCWRCAWVLLQRYSHFQSQ